MILTFDIGNTRTNIGLYENDSLVKKFWIYTKETQSALKLCLSENIGTAEIDGAVIASVVKGFDKEVCGVVEKMYGIIPVIVGYQSKLPVKLSLETPETLGADRIVNGSYAYSIYKQSVIVIDCGSAITFDIVNDKAEFVGGIIALGLNNQLKSISSSTSALPQLEAAPIKTVIGKNTKEAVLSGVIRGTASMIDGMIKQCCRELEISPKIVLTGGDALIIHDYLDTKIDMIEPDLILMGLNYLYNLNNV